MLSTLLIYSGLFLYTFNYIIGWLLFYKRIKVAKRTHQIFFAGVIVILVLQLVFLRLGWLEIILDTGSLGCMIALPFGVKGGVYHRVVSSLGLVLYLGFLGFAG